jgi:hypothetical protein
MLPVELFARLVQGGQMSASWIPNAMASILRRRIAALELFTVELFRNEENPDDCNELLTALSQLRSLRKVLSDLSDGVGEPS